MSDEKEWQGSEDLPDVPSAADVPDLRSKGGWAAEDAPLTEAQRLEAERRLLAYENNPEKWSTWEEVKRRLESKR